MMIMEGLGPITVVIVLVVAAVGLLLWLHKSLFCHKCGSKVSEKDTICPNCGQELRVIEKAEEEREEHRSIIDKVEKKIIGAVIVILVVIGYAIGMYILEKIWFIILPIIIIIVVALHLNDRLRKRRSYEKNKRNGKRKT